MRTLPILLAAALAAGSSAQSIVYSKKFPGSRPEFVEIRLTRDGKVEFREAADEDDPLTFKLTPAETDEIFHLAGKLDRFTRPLESGLKVARMGDKTFRWIDGQEKNEQTFNYSLDADAQALHDWFERMTESELYFIELERTVKYDRLGVNQALLKLEAAWDKKRIVGREQFLPLLDRVAKNDGYMNMARERAAKLAAAFRADPPAHTAAEPGKQ
jgi:hypothetical protein